MDSESLLQSKTELDACKDYVQKLMRERDQLENEIKELREYLLAPGMPGLSGGLIDNEGFPISDVEKIIKVRESRGQLAMKQNDYTALMVTIEEGLYKLHSLAKKQPQLSNSVNTQEKQTQTDNSGNSILPGESNLIPFAVADMVSPDSPASESNLRKYDLILKFGTVDHTNNRNLAALKDFVTNSENTPIRLVVRRDTTLVVLYLTPHKWAGKGLLGCYLVPYKGN